MSAKGGVALVTGAASGIGKRIAKVLADNGAHIAVADTNQAAAQALADEIKTRGTAAVIMDVSDEADVGCLRPVLRRIRQQCLERPIDRRQSRLAHETTA